VPSFAKRTRKECKLGSPAPKRYPYDELLRVARDIPEVPGNIKNSWHRWGILADEADEVANLHGVTPYEAWPEFVEELEFKECKAINCDEPLRGGRWYCDKPRKECAADCKNVFHPIRANQRFCSKTCQHRVSMRKYRRGVRGKATEKRYRDKYRSECHDYILKRAAQYREENRERILKQKREYYQRNREKLLEKAKQYHRENRTKRLESIKRWYRENREARLEYSRRYYESKKRERDAS
jgi:hypothetical protein